MKKITELTGYEKIPRLKKIIRIMKLTGFFIALSVFTALAGNSYSQTKLLNLDMENTTVKEVLSKIEDQSEFYFMYSGKVVDVDREVSVNYNNKKIDEVLKSLFEGTDVHYVVKDRFIVLTDSDNGDEIVDALQQNSISGTVTDESGQPLPGVTVVIKGTTNGTATNMDGKYSISNIPENTTLIFSFVGMKKQEVDVAGKTSLDVVMETDTEKLEEVVVTALGILSKKKSLGYSTDNVAGEAIANSKETNIVNALAGKVAGIVVSPSSAGMGGSSRLIIRGNSSITGNNQPLYVVDGIPIFSAGFGSTFNAGKGINSSKTDYGSAIADINPDDIESMSVLKGPNAAALYGSRAANGVIIINTKKGRSRKGLGVSYSGDIILSEINPNTLPEFQNEYGQGTGGVFSNSTLENWGPKFDGREFQTVNGLTKTYSPSPNNVKNFFETGIETRNVVGIEAGNENANVYLSYTNFNGAGIIPNSTLVKNNFNLRTNLNLSEKLNIDAKMTYFIEDAVNRSEMGWSDHNVLIPVYRMIRNGDIEDYEDYGDESTGTKHPYNTIPDANPYWTLYKNTNTTSKSRIQGFAKATYKFNENLSLFARIGTDALTQKIKQIVPYGFFKDPVGYRSDSYFGVNETNADFLFMFNRKISDSFNLNVNAGGNYMFGSNNYMNTNGRDFKIPESTTYPNLRVITVDEGRQRFAIYSAYISGVLDFKEKVYLNFSGRNDWSSEMWTKSGSSNDWSFFYPSFSLSFLGNDIFGIEENFLSFSKLRMSWSEVGAGGSKNDQIFYDFVGSGQPTFNGLIAIEKSNIYDDPDLKPERTQSTEIGLELKFLQNRLYTDFTYYDINTFDQILNAPVDASTGFNYVRTNVGELSNKGIEWMIGATPVKTSDFTWDVSLNLAKNKNKLVSFIEGVESYIFTTYTTFSVKTKPGGYFGDIYGSDYVYHNGKIVVNNNGYPVASEEKLLGNYQPDLTGGFFNQLNYKNLSLSFLVDARIGGEACNYTRRNLGALGSITPTLEGRDGMILDAYVNAGTEESPNYVQNTTDINAQGYWNAISTLDAAHMVDLTNIRLRELSLSYKLPSKIFANNFINSASISLTGRNLFFIYKNAKGVDPETSVSVSNTGQGAFYNDMPTTRRIGFSVKVSF